MINKLSIQWYLEKTIALLEISPLENQFQDFIVYPIIDLLISSNEIREMEVVDCHNFRQFNTNSHNRCKYSVLVKAVPDLIIAKDFFYHNRENQIYNALQIIASIEVKEPNNKWMLDRYVKSEEKNQKEYDNKLYLELAPSLFKNKKAILTNIRRWEFFDISNIKEKELIDKIELYIRILELCGFDSATDYDCIQMTVDSKIKKKYVLKQDVIDVRWQELEKIEELEEKTRIPRESVQKKHFDEIVTYIDNKYMCDIKKFVQKACTKTLNVITSEGQMIVNRRSFEDVNEDGISSISDLQYDISEWENLFCEMEDFLYK